MEFSPIRSHKSISPQLSQRHQRLIHQRSTPASIGRTSKFQLPRQSEETLARLSKPMLQRSYGLSGSGSGGSSNKLDSGTRESSIGE